MTDPDEIVMLRIPCARGFLPMLRDGIAVSRIRLAQRADDELECDLIVTGPRGPLSNPFEDPPA